MKKIFVSMLFVFGVCGLSYAKATSTLPTKSISMEVKNLGAKDAIVALLKQSDIKYELPATLTNDKKVSIEVKEMSWADVFKTTIANAGFTYSFDAKSVMHLTPVQAK